MKVKVIWNKKEVEIEITNKQLQWVFEEGFEALAERRDLPFWEYLAIRKLWEEGKIGVKLK